MQIPFTNISGVVDSFFIESSSDNFNNIDLDFKWIVVVFSTKKTLLNFVKTNKSMAEGVEGLGDFSALTVDIDVGSKFKDFVFYYPNVYGYILCLEEHVDYEIIAHECYHAAYCTLVRSVDKVVFDSFEQQEILAYLTGQFTKSFHNEYNNRKSRAGLFRTKSNVKNKGGIQRVKGKISKGK